MSDAGAIRDLVQRRPIYEKDRLDPIEPGRASPAGRSSGSNLWAS
ncbi:MAG: hypothetical protein QM729_03305 [Solirubrobacterales bacterium]